MRFRGSYFNSLLMWERKGIEEGEFGHHCPYWCESCGFIDREPESYISHRGCGFEGFAGPEPDEYEAACVYCGSIETGENEEYGSFKSRRLFKIFISSRRAA